MICKRSRPVLVLHERKTRITLMSRLAGKTAVETIAAMTATFRRLDPRMRGSVTFDNYTCFARHMLLRGMLSVTTYFCDAYASWQKSGVENANGRLRRWLPRGTNLDTISEEDRLAHRLRNSARPRRRTIRRERGDVFFPFQQQALGDVCQLERLEDRPDVEKRVDGLRGRLDRIAVGVADAVLGEHRPPREGLGEGDGAPLVARVFGDRLHAGVAAGGHHQRGGQRAQLPDAAALLRELGLI